MTSGRSQCGFSLITAIFLLVVLAVLMVNMLKIGGMQRSTVVMGVQGARAFQAARSGIEYGIYQALNLATCDASQTLNFPAADNGLEGFSVLVQCSRGSHVENVSPVNVYEITATASRGAYAVGVVANPDYVSRKIRVTVSNDPP